MLKGVLTALVTPMDGEKLDLRAFEAHVAWQVESGVDGLVVAGTTGEAPTLTAEERRDLLGLALGIAKGRIPVVMGVGSYDTRTTLDQAEVAERDGADALLVVTPYYNRPTQEGLIRHYEIVLDAARIPVLAYNVPARTGVDLLPATVARLVKGERFAGIKEATGNMDRALELGPILGPDRSLLSGDDTTWLPFLACGGHGIISVTSNVAPQQTVALQRAWDAGHPAEALDLARRIQPLSRTLFVETNPGPVKAALVAMGRIRQGIRAPLAWPAPQSEIRIRRALADLGILG
jgi:4-hydroxy-tetrahydrodipicolinate synthase